MATTTIEVYEDGVLVGSEVVEIPQHVTNGETLHQQARAALATNRTFLALASPTNAQTLAEVKALARQNNAIIRLLLNDLDGTD